MKEQSGVQATSTAILGPMVWICLGVASGLGALLLGVGTWNSPIIVAFLGVGLAVGLAVLVSFLDSRQPSELLLPVVLCLVFSLVAFVWFSDAFRGAVLDSMSDFLPEMALNEAFMTEDVELSSGACRALLHRNEMNPQLSRLLSQRPHEAARCLSNPDVENVERRDNLVRRLSTEWSALLRQGSGSDVCELAGPLGQLYEVQDGGLQRLLLVTLRASSAASRACLNEVVRTRVAVSSDLEFISALGPVDQLEEPLAAQLQGVLSSTLASPDPVVDFQQQKATALGWTLRLSCRDDMARNPEVLRAVGELLRSKGCGTLDGDTAADTWPRVCRDLSDVSLKEAPGEACEQTNHWAHIDAMHHASAQVLAATQSFRRGAASKAIAEADRINRRDQRYEELFGFESQMRSVEQKSNIPPLMRGEILSELSKARNQSRQLSMKQLAAAREMRSIRSVDDLRSRVDEITDPENRPPIHRETWERILESEDLSDEARDHMKTLLEE